jgi:hypothetical protein
MSTLNGIGIRFNRVSRPDNKGHVKATMWVTFLYLPIIPLWKAEVIRENSLPLREFKYRVIHKLPLDVKEILITYLYGWILIPILMFGPIVFIMPEVTESLGIPSPPSRNLIKGDPLNWHDWFFISFIIYLVITVLKLRNRDFKRGLPENYKDILKEKDHK